MWLIWYDVMKSNFSIVVSWLKETDDDIPDRNDDKDDDDDNAGINGKEGFFGIDCDTLSFTMYPTT